MRILSIDPGTRMVGVTIWDDGRFVADRTFITDHPQRAPFTARVGDLADQLHSWVWLGGTVDPDLILVELGSSFGRRHPNQANLMYAAGALVGTVLAAHPGTEIVSLNPADWCRYKNGKMAKKGRMLAQLRKRHGDLDEHVLCARAFVDWYLAKREANS